MFQKIIYSFIFVVLSMANSFAQELNVKLKKGQVLINGQHAYDYAFFNHKKELYLYKIGSDEDLIILQRIAKKIGEEHENFYFIYFSDLKKSLETKEYIHYPWEFILNKMHEKEVIANNGKINTNEAEQFMLLYNENLTRHLISGE